MTAIPLRLRPSIQRKPTTLYRLFDADGVLLYVGVTCDWAMRRYAHAREKSWWGRVTHCELVEYPDRPAAVEAEYAAIATERPLFNVVGPTGKPQGRRRAA